jgi:gliding motility-associated-like protein
LRLFVLSISLLFPLFLLSQNGNNTNIWYFGEYAGLDFNSGAPVVLNNSAMNTLEGCATICNGDGELLFYTDGLTVWNQEHEVMDNGTGLLGNSSSSQSSIVVPAPGFEDQYYIFTTMVGAAGMRYSIVDMSLDGGIGGVVVNEKNILFHEGVTEKLVATLHSNFQDFWIIGHEWGNNNYVAYRLTPAGLENQPVVSAVGEVLYIGGYYQQHSVGCFQVSYQGDMLAAANFFDSGNFELFNFDNATGELTFLDQSESSFYRAYGVEFSPDGNLLYGTVDNEEYTDGRVYQFDLNQPNPLDNPVQVGAASVHMPGIQLAPDGKIYVTQKSTSNLAVINEPNELGADCDFNLNAIDLSPGIAWRGLPQIQVYEYFDFNIIEPDELAFCEGDSIEVTSAFEGADSYLWSTGQSTLSIFVSEPGTYTLELTEGENVLNDSVVVTMLSPSLDLGPDLAICEEQELPIEAEGNFDSIEWFDGSEGDEVEVTSEGTYWAEASIEDCLVSDSVIVSQVIIPDPELMSEYFICEALGQVEVSAQVADGVDVLWSNDDTDASTTYDEAGTQWLELNDGDCSLYEEFEIVQAPQELIQSSDTAFCEGSTVDVSLIDDAWDGSWNIAEMGSSIEVDEAGSYQVSVEFGSCTIEDQIEVEMISDPGVGIDDQLICPNDNFTLNIQESVDQLWLNGNEISNNHTIQSAGQFNLDYAVDVCSFSTNFQIDNYQDTLSLKTNYEFCEDDTIEISVDPLINPHWSDGSTDSTFTVTETGEYQLNFEMIGCEFSRTLFVEPTIECPCDEPVFVPNAFTPDSDGINDFFKPVIFCPLSDYELRVFNRWGEVVFYSSDPQRVWDGSHKNGDYYVENGVYQYVLQIKRIIEVEDEVYTGHITIFR